MTDTIKQILTAEKKADDLVKTAQKQKEKIISAARAKALALTAKRKKEIEDNIDVLTKEQILSLEKKKRELLHQFELQSRSLQQKATMRVKEAAHLLAQRVLQEDNCDNA